MEYLHGLLDMLVLKSLVRGPVHGYGIAKSLRFDSDGRLDVEFGSLYPALKRLELRGWIAAKWDTSEHNRRAKYYHLTAKGRRQLHREHDAWLDFVGTVKRVMDAKEEAG